MDVSDDYSLKDAIYPPAGNNSSSRRESGGGVTPLPGFDGRPKSAASEGPVEPPRTQSEIEVQVRFEAASRLRLAHFCVILARFCVILAHFCVILARFGVTLSSFSRHFCVVLASFWHSFGSFGAALWRGLG
jgi:hypothetical protein